MTDAQAFRTTDHRQPNRALPDDHATIEAGIEAGIATLSALARRECANLGRLLSRHAAATDRAALDAAITASAQTLAVLNADLACLRSALSRPQAPDTRRVDAAA